MIGKRIKTETVKVRDRIDNIMLRSPIDGSEDIRVPSADIERAWPGDKPYSPSYLSCGGWWLASFDLDLNLDLLNRVRMAPKKSRFFFLLRPRSPVGRIHVHVIYYRIIVVLQYYFCRFCVNDEDPNPGCPARRHLVRQKIAPTPYDFKNPRTTVMHKTLSAGR